MITYNKCKAISELFTVLLDVKKYLLQNNIYILRSKYDIEHKDFRIEFFSSGNCELFRTYPVYTRLCTIGMCTSLRSVFKEPKEKEGYLCTFSDHSVFMHKDEFVTRTGYDNVFQPLWVNDCKHNQDEVESALFQISTVYNEEDADLVILYNFIRNALEGSRLRLSFTDLLLECTICEVHVLSELTKSRFHKIQEDYPVGECK